MNSQQKQSLKYFTRSKSGLSYVMFAFRPFGSANKNMKYLSDRNPEELNQRPLHTDRYSGVRF